MLFLTAVRREVLRALLDELGRTVAFDTDGAAARADRSRWRHLRNGVGALMLATSRVAWRPTPLVSLFYLLKATVQSELAYGVAELGHALAPPAAVRNSRSRWLAVAPLPIAVAVLVARRRQSAEGDEPLPPIPAPPEPVSVAP